jgi:CTP synthase (UTP-ammonia lyase)
VLGIEDADHEESAPLGSKMFISKLVCSLVGNKQVIRLAPDSTAYEVYGGEDTEVEEQFYCNYGLNPAYRSEIEKGDLKVAGTGPEGEARVIELPSHRFFIATLFLPQLSSSPDNPHPLIVAYLKAALRFQSARLASR